jgi:hypothetical protein
MTAGMQGKTGNPRNAVKQDRKCKQMPTYLNTDSCKIGHYFRRQREQLELCCFRYFCSLKFLSTELYRAGKGTFCLSILSVWPPGGRRESCSKYLKVLLAAPSGKRNFANGIGRPLMEKVLR